MAARANENARTSSRQNSCLVVVKMTSVSHVPRIATATNADLAVANESLDRASARHHPTNAFGDLVSRFIVQFTRFGGRLTTWDSSYLQGVSVEADRGPLSERGVPAGRVVPTAANKLDNVQICCKSLQIN